MSTALKRPLLVLVVLFVEEVFLKPPYRDSVLLLIVSALSVGASPSITKTSFTPISVKDETLKNKFLHTEMSLRIEGKTSLKNNFIGRNERLPQIRFVDSPHHRLDVLGLTHPQAQVYCECLSAQTIQWYRLTNRFND